MASTQPVDISNSHFDALQRSMDQVNRLILGKPEAVKLIFCSLLANGHVLLEDLPGLGKTTLANAMAVTLGLDFGRIQFTSDVLPADVIGLSIYSRQKERFEFQPGPIFNQIVLADEINRAPPRTQSAFMEAMAENHVTVDGTIHPLPQPFFVIATQNPVDFAGTWPLPDSQLDRFLIHLSLGYPDKAAERQMLEEPNRQVMLRNAKPVLNEEQLQRLVELRQGIHCSPAIYDYVQRLLSNSRQHPSIEVGLSPRAGLALIAIARAHALLSGRNHVLPDDIKAIFNAVSRHRLRLSSFEQQQAVATSQIVQELLDKTIVES